ncbi:MAG: hypothetical protein GXP51_07325 [Deltaproteobacteria bacterium]|nr:hypothetical protein [Deltaproteobacteria bacterium]
MQNKKEQRAADQRGDFSEHPEAPQSVISPAGKPEDYTEKTVHMELLIFAVQKERGETSKR